MPALLGYSDRFSARPGEQLSFHVSCAAPTYRSRLVRLVHGDTNPAGPGYKELPVASDIELEHAGQSQGIRSGSYGVLPVAVPAQSALTFLTFVQPWLPGQGEQVLVAQGDPFGADGWALILDDAGRLALVEASGGATDRHVLSGPVARWQWYHLAVAMSAERTRATVWLAALPQWPGAVAVDGVAIDLAAPASVSAGSDLLVAATRRPDGTPDRPFDGKIDRPRLLPWATDAATVAAMRERPDDEQLLADALGVWDLSVDVAGRVIHDHSTHGAHGRLVNMPTRAVTGYNHDGQETSFRLAPRLYGAVHFHRDDLEDAGWPVAFTLTVPEDLPSGPYAVHLTDGDHVDRIPFVVASPRGVTRSRVAVLMSSMTYLVYSNFTDLGQRTWSPGEFRGSALTHPFADATVDVDAYRYIDENSLYATYDHHLDGSGVVYSSTLRPILNLRPDFRYRVLDTPARFGADLYLTDWLDHMGIEVDYITDHQLHEEGAGLLQQYRVVVSSSHHEYWTEPMLDGLQRYLGSGGRFMYLGGNSLYGVVSVDPDAAHRVEVRRWGSSWPFECPPAERYHSTTGEAGGTWRNRGRAANRIVGVGSAGAGFDRGSGYGRMPDSHDPRVAFVFAGLDPDALIGDVPSLQLRWGAGGYEFDRCETELGSPSTTLVLASTVRFNQSHKGFLDEQLWFAGGRHGEAVEDPHVPGRPHRFVRSDLTYLEYPDGGAVFSAGAISWRSCLSAYDYQNSVSMVTENVLRRFADTPSGSSPADQL